MALVILYGARSHQDTSTPPIAGGSAGVGLPQSWLPRLGPGRGRQRYRCQTCRRGFTATSGTPFRKLKTDWVEVLEALALLAERNSLSAVARVKQIKRDTLARWLKKVGAYAQEVEEMMVREFGVSQVQLDELWTHVRNRGGKGGIRRLTRAGSSGRRRPLTQRASCA